MVQDVKDRSECNNWNKFIQEARNEKEGKKERKIVESDTILVRRLLPGVIT
jgi:hypothetical protein